jgi:3',5'-nucleoside bisphosphate phosphatase
VPKSDPFTRLCGRLAQLEAPVRADLHIHTTASDGEYTPEQVVALARSAGLSAVAITDHDTLAAVDKASAAGAGHIEVIPGVEISTAFAGREFHLLGYFLRPDHDELNAALANACRTRRERFRALLALLSARGLTVRADRARLVEEASVSLGRRHVAGLLVACGHARTRAEAFHRLVNPLISKAQPKALVPIDVALRLINAAGGVASLAHPPADLTEEQLAELRARGLGAIEVVYPWGRNSPVRLLRESAARYGLAVSGGSDSHGPDRPIGSHAVSGSELAALRERAGCAGH